MDTLTNMLLYNIMTDIKSGGGDVDSLWRDGSRASQIYFISGGHKPVNLHQWGPGVRDVYALHYIIRGQGTLETGGQHFRLGAGESFIIFPQRRSITTPTLLTLGNTYGWSSTGETPGEL